MAKLSRLISQDGKLLGYMIFCPACKEGHVIYTNNSNSKCNWTFNENFEKPTFSPSLLLHESLCQKRCHSFIKDGKIQFLSDCGHNMASQTIDLPDVEKDKQNG